MGENLIRFIEERLIPLVHESGQSDEMEDLLQTLHEIVEDIRNGVMDEWECGELYEEFKKYEQNGTLIENMM